MGKLVTLRNYNDQREFDYNPDTSISNWKENIPYKEWKGIVCDVLQNDNSHVDIIFQRDHHHKYPEGRYLQDCYNWHMRDYMILETIIPDETNK